MSGNQNEPTSAALDKRGGHEILSPNLLNKADHMQRSESRKKMASVSIDYLQPEV